MVLPAVYSSPMLRRHAQAVQRVLPGRRRPLLQQPGGGKMCGKFGRIRRRGRIGKCGLLVSPRQQLPGVVHHDVGLAPRPLAAAAARHVWVGAAEDDPRSLPLLTQGECNRVRGGLPSTRMASSQLQKFCVVRVYLQAFVIDPRPNPHPPFCFLAASLLSPTELSRCLGGYSKRQGSTPHLLERLNPGRHPRLQRLSGKARPATCDKRG